MTIRPGRKDAASPQDQERELLDELRTTRRLVSRTCAWCGELVPYSGRGRPAIYCSKSCRNRAWEVRSAEARLQRDIAAGVLRTEPVREVIRETVDGNRTVTARSRLRAKPPVPAAPHPAPNGPDGPTTAHAWLAQLDALAEQLREGELGRQHWYHAKLYNALLDVLADLGDAYPGGLDRLRNEVTQRRR